MVAVVSILAGLILLVAGVLKIGRAVTYIPWPVIEGFTLGIAVIIFVQQVPAATGTVAGSSRHAVIATLQGIATLTWSAAVWPLATVVLVASIMLLAPRLSARIPGSLVAIAAVTVLATLAHLPMTDIGRLPSSLPRPSLPSLDWKTVSALGGSILTVAALAAIESLLSARVAASISDTGPYDAGRELVGQGMASLAAGFFGGLPATGAIARTAVNVRAGGRTRLAAVVHALLLLAVVYLATGVVSQIPLAALAGVLMVTACRMISVATVRSIVGSTRSDTIVFIITAVVTVTFDLIVAVAIGVAVAGFFALRGLSRSAGVHREALPGRPLPGDEHIALFRLDGALFFGTAERILDRVNEIEGVHVVILRMSQLQVLDATGARVITEMIRTLEQRGVTVLVKGIQPDHLRLVTRVGVLESLRHQNHLFADLPRAVEHARSHVVRQSEVLWSGPGLPVNRGNHLA